MDIGTLMMTRYSDRPLAAAFISTGIKSCFPAGHLLKFSAGDVICCLCWLYGLILTYIFWVSDSRRRSRVLCIMPCDSHSSHNLSRPHQELRTHDLQYIRLLLNVRRCQTKCLLICGRHNMPGGVMKPGLVYFWSLSDRARSACLHTFSSRIHASIHTYLCYCRLNRHDSHASLAAVVRRNKTRGMLRDTSGEVRYTINVHR